MTHLHLLLSTTPTRAWNAVGIMLFIVLATPFALWAALPWLVGWLTSQAWRAYERR